MPDPSTDSVARALAEEQHGAVAMRQLRAAGVSERLTRHLRGSPGWEEITDEVIRLVGSARTPQQRLMVAVLDAGPGAVLSHDTAGRAWGLTGCPATPIHTTRTSSSRRSSSLSRLHQIRELPPGWITTLDAIPVVRPELLALQLFAVHSTGRAERLVERLWADRLLSGHSILRLLDEYGSRGRNGTAGLRAYAELRGPDYTPAASGVEARTMQILRNAGFDFRRQVDSGRDGWDGRVDFRHAELPLVVEVQSERHHTALTDTEADGARRERLEAAGFVVIELTDVLVWTRPDLVIERVWAGMTLARGRRRRSVPQ